MRIALVHDWLTGMRGGEWVLEAFAELFPTAEIFTLIDFPERISPLLRTFKRHTSILQKIPGIEKNYRFFLPLMPFFIEQFDLSNFDFILSSSHCVAKGIKKPTRGVHISYVHAPMRYMWDRYEDYFSKQQASLLVRTAARILRFPLQAWDRRASQASRVDTLIANSFFIADQIKNAYGREAHVVHPFADLSRFNLPRTAGSFYLIVSAFAPYKRIDLAIEAFNRLQLPLVIVGSGQNENQLKKLAGSSIQFAGALSNEKINELYSQCRAFLFPGVEDFGITAVEALAAGAPVIAYGRGGVTETVTPRTGIFFKEQSVESLMQAVIRMEKEFSLFSEHECRLRAQLFSKDTFKKNITRIILNEQSFSKVAGSLPIRTLREDALVLSSPRS